MAITNRIGDTLKAADTMLTEKPWLGYAVAALCYILVQAPKLLVIGNFDILVFPLQSIEIARQLMFDGAHLRPSIATLAITPVNGMLIYPPGIYALSGLLGSVKLIFIFHLLIQLFVPLLVFALLSAVTTRACALIAALLGCYYFVNVTWWAPDFIIQPVMLVALLVLSVQRPDQPFRASRLVVAGLLTGVIMIFKQNIGLFFGIMVGTYEFLSCLREARSTPAKGTVIFWLLIAGFLAFGLTFFRTLVHWDEAIFYLVPYFVFWIAVVVHFARHPFSFDITDFLRRAAFYVAGAVIVPAAVFLYFGGTMGYGRYFSSLFALGMNKLPLWDKGLPAAIAQGASFGNPLFAYRTMMMAALYLLPALVALVAALQICRARTLTQGGQLRMAALPVMGLLMLFPLESSHILLTKLFLFVFVGLYMLHREGARFEKAIIVLMALLLLPVLGFAGINLITQIRLQTTGGTQAMQKVIGLPLEKGMEGELEKQTVVLEGAVTKMPFYVVDSTSGTLWSLNALEPGAPRQYYLLMQPGLLDERTLSAVEQEMTGSRFVVVNTDEYDRAAHGGIGDPGLDALYRRVHEDYTPLASYTAPPNRPATWHNILDFTVLRRKPA